VRAPEIGRVLSSPLIASWARELRSLNPDLVHVHMPNPVGEMAALRSRLPLVATYHADIPRARALVPAYVPVQQRFLARCRRIVVSNPAMADVEPLRPHRDRVIVIPFGVDPDQWHRPAAADELDVQVLFLGRLVHYKGLPVLMEAMRSVDAGCAVVGDGPVRPPPPGNVSYVGAVPDPERAAWYHAADVFVLPSTSRAETFGISMLEAMACGTPAISTEVGTGTSWLNVDGETGLVVAPGDPHALVRALHRLLGDDGLRRRMGEAAQRRVSAHFTRRAMLDSLRQMYESALA